MWQDYKNETDNKYGKHKRNVNTSNVISLKVLERCTVVTVNVLLQRITVHEPLDVIPKFNISPLTNFCTDKMFKSSIEMHLYVKSS